MHGLKGEPLKNGVPRKIEKEAGSELIGPNTIIESELSH